MAKLSTSQTGEIVATTIAEMAGTLGAFSEVALCPATSPSLALAALLGEARLLLAGPDMSLRVVEGEDGWMFYLRAEGLELARGFARDEIISALVPPPRLLSMPRDLLEKLSGPPNSPEVTI